MKKTCYVVIALLVLMGNLQNVFGETIPKNTVVKIRPLQQEVLAKAIKMCPPEHVFKYSIDPGTVPDGFFNDKTSPTALHNCTFHELTISKAASGDIYSCFYQCDETSCVGHQSIRGTGMDCSCAGGVASTPAPNALKCQGSKYTCTF